MSDLRLGSLPASLLTPKKGDPKLYFEAPTNPLLKCCTKPLKQKDKADNVHSVCTQLSTDLVSPAHPSLSQQLQESAFTTGWLPAVG